MKVHLIGTGTAVPDPNHTQSCMLISSDDGSSRIVVDLAGGAINHLPAWEDLRYFFFTHDHPDHVGGMDQLLQSHLFGRLFTPLDEIPPEIRLFGPPSVGELLEEIRERHFSGKHSQERLSRSLSWKSLMDGVLIESVPGFRIECLASGHTRDSLSFRVAADGKTVALTSDASIAGRLTEILSRADLAVVECSLPPGMQMPSHLNGEEIARVVKDLRERGPREIVLVHLYPPAREAEEAIRRAFPSPLRERIQFARDGQVVSA